MGSTAVSGATSASQFAQAPMIALEGVSKWFFSKGQRFVALDNVSLEIARGSFVTLLGPSGCGKSTIFNMIAGFLFPDRGRVWFDGKPLTKPNVGIGYMTQRDALLPWRTVIENVTLPLSLQNVPSSVARERALTMLERVGLESFVDHVPAELSGGMQKRCALARTLVFNPDMLLMDEPFGNVDVQLRSQLQRILTALWESERKTVVFVTHDLEEAIALSDTVIVLSRRPGRIKAVVPIDLPRPRDPVEMRFQPAFVELRRRLWELCDSAEDDA